MYNSRPLPTAVNPKSSPSDSFFEKKSANPTGLVAIRNPKIAASRDPVKCSAIR
jgi:hypothetical protein